MARTRGRRRSGSAKRDFERGVFVNCPFDSDYRPLLESLLFTIIDFGLAPRIASDVPDSGRARIDRIAKLVRGARFAVHDLSRIQATKVGELSRLNMSFELGIDVGCRRFEPSCKRKVSLILETRRYRYQKAISDMAGSDIAAHGGRPQRVVSAVRNWLSAHTNISAPGPSKIWNHFGEFVAANFDILRSRGFSKRDIQNLSINELMKSMTRWVSENPWTQ